MTLPQKKIPSPPAGPTYLPAAVSVSQEAKKDAEYHVAEKHHLEWGEKKLSSKQSFYNMLTSCTKLPSNFTKNSLETVEGEGLSYSSALTPG